MPKPYTFPTLYNEALQISTTKLKEWGYLKANQFKSGKLFWKSNGKETGWFSIVVDTHKGQPYIELDYNYRGEPRNYKVSLVFRPSNLGKGYVCYFLCPQTYKLCRKLYSIGGYFLHREAFKGCLYETQTQSKKYRQLDKTFGAYCKSESLFEELNSKHFKRTYAGKPTKRYLQIMKQIHQARSVTQSEIERLILN